MIRRLITLCLGVCALVSLALADDPSPTVKAGTVAPGTLAASLTRYYSTLPSMEFEYTYKDRFVDASVAISPGNPDAHYFFRYSHGRFLIWQAPAPGKRKDHGVFGFVFFDGKKYITNWGLLPGKLLAFTPDNFANSGENIVRSNPLFNLIQPLFEKRDLPTMPALALPATWEPIVTRLKASGDGLQFTLRSDESVYSITKLAPPALLPAEIRHVDQGRTTTWQMPFYKSFKHDGKDFLLPIYLRSSTTADGRTTPVYEITVDEPTIRFFPEPVEYLLITVPDFAAAWPVTDAPRDKILHGD